MGEMLETEISKEAKNRGMREMRRFNQNEKYKRKLCRNLLYCYPIFKYN